ncbi:autotransporter outer membrane beta-barrel domain-containing protein [Phascolarctobacterium succinatutens]|uniref:autotransporter outer membrane beta-barrel domain-containing protein n=3 Tax=Phascolarctobacterium succinatutens TaxID=626940 RepID=UPI003079D035
MLKLSQKKRKALLALAVAATVLGANNAFAASVHDKAISESNNYGSSMRTYWQNAGVYDAKTHTYTFNEDITLKPKTSEQNLNFWTPLFGGIYVAGYNPVTIDMQGHRLDVAMNMDPVAQGTVFNPGAISPHALHVTSSSLTINNVKGMELSAAGPGLATGNINGIYLAGTNQEGTYHDGKGLSSLTINNADGWDNAIKFHSSQLQVENGIYVWKNSGSADLKISGLIDMYVGNGSDVITVRGGDYTGDTQGVPTAYIGGGAFKTSTGRAANVVGGLLSVNSKLENGEIVASDANRDVQIDGNIRVGDVGRDQGTVTLGLNTADSYFKGIMYTHYGEGDAHMMLQNGAQWTNSSTSQGDYDYHGSSLKQFVGSEGAANTGYIFQKDNAALNLGNYSGYTTVFYEHNNDGTKTADYTAGNTIINTAKEGSNITLITDKVDVNNEATVNAALNALAGKLYYNAAKNGENNVEGMAVIAEGLTASSKALKTSGIYFDEENGQGTTDRFVNQKITDFTTTLTGVKEDDSEYAEANVIVGEGTYKFKKDTTINTEGSAAIDLKQGTTINASKRLTLNVGSESGSTVYALGASTADGVTVNADKLVINASSTDGRIEGINVGQGAQSKDKPMKLTINGDTEFNMKGIGYTLGLYANGNSEVTFNGNVTAMGNENSEWGLTSEEGAFGYYGCSLVYSGSNYSLQMGPKVTINGDVNAKIDGNALFANGGHAKLTINGGGNIEINKDNTHNYYAMIAESGTTSMNVNLDENYDAVSARDNKLVLKGNVGASTGAINANEPELYTKVNLGLATADSEWTGIAYNGFKDEGNKSGDKTFYGAINVFLQNGATWNNEQWGAAVDQFEGSHVAKFVGGESEATAGNIFQKDSRNLTIDNYSGNTNIFYAHTGNGEAAENYAAGDTVIKGAASNSVVSMITDNSGISMDNADSVNNVLKALAGKLTYSNYVNGENNLTGYVKIADGLTASSKALETGDISFSKEDGKGYYTNVPKPKTRFTTAITGNLEADTEYAGNIADGKYFFNGDSTITVGAATAADIKKALTIDAADHKLSIIATGGNWSEEKAFKHTASGTTKITAGELVIGQHDGGFYDRTGIAVEAGTVDITAAKTTVYAQNDFADVTYGVHANNGGRIDIHGDLDLKLNYAAPVHGLVAEDYDFSNKAAVINVDGKANIDLSGRDGNAVAAIRSGSTVNVGGGTIKAWNGQRNISYGLLADVGNINVNMNADKTAAGKNTTVINGNLKAYSSTGPDNHNEDVDSVINVGLSDNKSSLTGVAFAKDINFESETFKGIINMYLNNGATWNNQVWGKIDGGFDGSHLAKLAGGDSEATAGNIFQKDSRNLTIDNYSGNTNIFYAHEGNGEAAENYKAGDTVIKGAAAGSVVSMITDNTGIAMDNADSVTNVLNALAGKLTYSNYVNGENNLTGYVKIADGLTASSAALKTGGIAFNKEDGKGSYKKLPKTAFTTAITGDLEADTEYAGNIADGKYFFDGDSTITVGAATAADIKKALTIDAADHKLSIIATGGNWSEEKTFKHNAEGTTKITAGELVIGQPDGGYYDRTGMSVENGTVDITAAKTTIYAQNDFYTVTYGVHASNNNSRVDIHGDLDLKFNFAAPVHGLVADKGAAINVDGKANIDMSGRDGNAVAAINSGSAVNVGGGTIKAWNGQRNTSYGLLADSGIVNVNMNDDKTAAGTVTTVISGNVRANGEDGMINVGLSDKESSLTGVAFSQNNGVINMYLNNGAAWNNQVWGKTDGGFGGSHVAKLAGGDSEATAGNIFQKDSRNLTIDNYSGNTNIFYAHTGNGEAASDYAAGDTIIKGAAAGSVVSMITDNSGINMDNGVCVTNVLNALAGKLTYSNFVNGEKNLAGYVKIADGLTASSKAMHTGNIAFNADTGKGSLENGSMKPGFTYPETQTPESSKLNSGITGDAKADYQYKKDGILKEDGSYVFTQDPTKIEVKEGAAVGATDKDIVIDTTKAKLELKGATGINAEGANVTVNGNTSISGATGINAANGNVTLNGSTVISGTDAAINAGENGNVNVNGNNSALTVNGSINADGGNITVDSGKASSTIKGDVNAANGGSVVINLTEKNSEMTGGYNVDGNSSIALSLANGATWHLTDGEEAAGMSLLRMAKGAADAGLTINGGKTEAEKGFLDMTKRTKTLDIAHYSGWETVIYDHEGKGDKVEDYKSGDTVIAKADKGSGVILSTDGSGITMTDKKAVEATLKALAQKVTYKDHAANGENLSGKVQIAEGLTSSSVSKNLGTIHWDENGKGQYDLNSVNWSQIIEGDYETFVMKGVRSAATTSLHTWRDNMQDTYTGADLADEDGMFAKALGGKTSSDVKGLKDSNTYYGVQVGYDKAAANGWHTGVAFDYRNGDSNYLLGGKGDNQMYSLGVYGVKNFENDAFFRVAAKVGRVQNEYDVYNEIRSLKLHGDYKANAYGLTMEYGKTFGTEESYFTPKAQLTWSQVGAKDYTAHTDKATMQINQDSYSSFVGRLGFEAGVKSEKGRVYAGLFAAHEFNGDISASYFANDGDRKHTSFNGEETWMEMKLGGTYDFSNNAHLYADFAKDFNGNFERKWKLSAGLRFEF